MTAITGRVPLDRIERRARDAHPGRTAAAVIAGLLFGLGWLAYKTCAAVWLAIAWCASAVIEGWQSAKAQQRSRPPLRT